MSQGSTRPVVAAVDVGGTRIKAGLVHADGALTHDRLVPTPTGLGDTLIPTLTRVASEVVDAGRAQGLHASAAGVALTGIIDDTRGVGVYSADPPWRDVDVRGPLSAALGLPVAVGHDVRAGLVAEAWLGAARRARHVVFAAIGTGISAGILADGTPLVAGGYAGEIGHAVVVPDGPPCGCGARGCLEAVASAGAIGKRYAALVAARPGPGRPADGAATQPPPDARTVAGLVAAGDPVATEVWLDAIDHLARALALTCAAVGADLVVVGGGLVNAGGVLLDPLAERLTAYGGTLRPLRLLPAALGDRAGCLGAGRLALDLVAVP